MAIAHPAPPVATITPATAGPTIWAVEVATAGTGHQGQQPCQRGVEERLPGAEYPGKHQKDPQRRRSGQQQRGQQQLTSATDHIRADHYSTTGQPVGDDSADEHQADQRHSLRREHIADICRTATLLQDSEGQRDRHHSGPDQRNGVTGNKQPEIPLGQDT